MNKKDEPPLLHIATFVEVALAGIAAIVYNGYKQNTINVIETILWITIGIALLISLFALYRIVFKLKDKRK